MATTNVPAVQFTATGLVIPQESVVLSGVQADIDAAFGGGVNPALETPQGQLASSTAAIIGDANNTFAEFVNQVNPDLASGFMQDVIGRIYFLERKPALPTAVQCDCVGAVGTVIPVGSQAQDTSGNLYICTGAGTIPSGGTISLPFACTVTGPVSCPAGTLTQIYQAIPGWNTINNPGDGVPGVDVESRADFEYRRRQSVALNGHGSPQAIYASVFNVAGVIDAYVWENTTKAAVLTGATNYSVEANSIYVAVMGGASADIAKAIWLKKGTGCNYNGNTSVSVVDDSGYNAPYPTYQVKFEIPATLPILFGVQITNNPALPSNIVSLVQAAIISAFSGGDGGKRARIGATIFASRFYAPVSMVSPNVSIISILIGTTTATLNSVNVGIDQAPTVSAADISVTLV